MALFEFNILWLIVLGMAAFFGWLIVKEYFLKQTGGVFIVSFSEKLGDVIIEHEKQYQGIITKDGKSIIVKGVKDRDNKPLQRPRPPQWAHMPTFGKNKKVYILKLSEGKYAYRLPDVDNTVWTYKRDQDGKVIKVDGQVTLKKHKWRLCENVTEVDDRDWYEGQQRDKQEKHRKKDKWDAMKPVITMGIIFVFAVIALKITSDNWKYMIDKTSNDVEEQKQDVDRLLDAIQGFSNKQEPDPQTPPQGQQIQENDGGG